MEKGIGIEKKEAFDLYLKGVPKKEIARQLNKHYNTITQWERKYGWAEKRQEFIEKVQKDLIESNEEYRTRALTHYKNIMLKANEALLQGDVDIKLQDSIKASEAEAKLRGMAIDKTEVMAEIEHKGLSPEKVQETIDSILRREKERKNANSGTK